MSDKPEDLLSQLPAKELILCYEVQGAWWYGWLWLAPEWLAIAIGRYFRWKIDKRLNRALKAFKQNNIWKKNSKY